MTERGTCLQVSASAQRRTDLTQWSSLYNDNSEFSEKRLPGLLEEPPEQLEEGRYGKAQGGGYRFGYVESAG